MSTMSKVFVVLNLVLALFLVGTNASMLSNNDDFRRKLMESEESRTKERAKAKTDLDLVNGDKATRDLENRALQNQKADLESQLGTQKATADQFRNDNNQLRNAIDAINLSLKSVQGDLADVQGRNKALMDSNETCKKETADAKKAQMDAEDDRARIEGDLKRATDDVAEKERQLAEATKERDNLRAQLEALTKLGVPVAELIGNNVPLIEAKVSEVGPGFVVLSVGEHDSVKVGYSFHIYRGAEYIGRVVVDRVLPDSSTARVTLKNSKNLEFKALDSATTRL